MVRSEFGKAVGATEAERQGWRYYSDGLGELLPFCEVCSQREFEVPDSSAARSLTHPGLVVHKHGPMVQTVSMTARLGADDIDLFATPRRGLLHEVSGITPVEPNGHVLLNPHGVRSIQRLALADIGGGVVAGLWPAEMKSQALALYAHGLATPMIATARERGWSVEASPHIAFFNSTPAQRLYMSPKIDPADYALRWETSDLGWIRQYSTDEVATTLWPWLKQRGYASDTDDDALKEFASRSLKRRPAHLRPGLRLKRRWSIEELRTLDGSDVAAAIRDDVDAILNAAGEPSMPNSMR